MTASRPVSLYRPQFPYPSIRECKEEQFHYTFDSTDIPALGLAIPAASFALNIVLHLEPDAAFLWRGFKVSNSGLAIRFKDPYGNYLSPCAVPIELYGTCPTVFSEEGGFCVAFSQGIYCPPGGNVLVDFYNPTAGSLTPSAITLYGVKRLMLRSPVCK